MDKIREKEFNQKDPYNPENIVEGIVLIGAGHYGDLHIIKVNGEECDQWVRATPQFKYPGGASSPFKVVNYNIPYEECRVYDKLDGTNILLFKYYDARGNMFVSYKTRLTPFLREEGYSTWITMWNRMLKKYDFEQFYPGTNNYAFELYGLVNKIVIEYSVALDCALLYSVGLNGELNDCPNIFDFPRPVTYPWTWNSFEEGYKYLEAEMERRFTEDRDVEGVVIYTQFSEGVKPYKCKAPSILSEQGGGKTISYKEVWTTALNALESGDDTRELLLEVYSEAIVDIYSDLIDRVIKEAEQYIKFRYDVIHKYEDLGLNIVEDRRKCMSTMMQYYPRDKSREVYNILIGLYGEEQ